MRKYVIAYDIGTTSLKTCLFELSDKISLVASKSDSYHLRILENGGAEQDPNEWWDAMCRTTRALLQGTQIAAEEIDGITFCAQMQGMVLVDYEGNPVRNAMSYMDNRAKQQMQQVLGKGIRIEGMNVFKLLKSICITRVVASSAKDPVWKYNWVKENEPENFDKVYKWLDAKEFLICRATGKFVMTEDSAYATMLFDVRKEKRKFSKSMCAMLGVNINHLPSIVKSTEVVGVINKRASEQLDLPQGIPVFGGGGDASLIGVGAGAAALFDTHIYLGTSGWVSTVINKPKLDIIHKIAGIVGANEKTYNYFAEMETAGKCVEWVKEHLAYEETINRLTLKNIENNYEDISVDLYDYMMESIKNVPAGSNGIIFTPWLHGNRCPFEDTNARGIFLNIGIQTQKKELIRSVVEGICYHLRWLLESIEQKVPVGNKVRLVGGGALAPTTCQILADVLGKEIEVPQYPQNAGAMGAAIVASIGLNTIQSLNQADSLVSIEKKYYPRNENIAIYNKQFDIFKALYDNNKTAFAQLST